MPVKLKTSAPQLELGVRNQNGAIHAADPDGLKKVARRSVVDWITFDTETAATRESRR
jgi:hypothetical protein